MCQGYHWRCADLELGSWTNKDISENIYKLIFSANSWGKELPMSHTGKENSLMPEAPLGWYKHHRWHQMPSGLSGLWVFKQTNTFQHIADEYLIGSLPWRGKREHMGEQSFYPNGMSVAKESCRMYSICIRLTLHEAFLFIQSFLWMVHGP